MDKKENKITRRMFVNLGAKGYAGVQLASVLPASMLATAGGSSAEASTFHGVCYHDCPDSCSWEVKVREGKVISFGGKKLTPLQRASFVARWRLSQKTLPITIIDCSLP